MPPPRPNLAGLLKSGLDAFNAGRFAEAQAAFAAALSRDPRNADALHLSGLAALRRGRAEEAVTMIARAIAFNPREASFRSNLAVALKAAGRRDDAIAALRQAIEIAPGHVQAHVNLGNTLREAGELEAAGDAYRRALALAPDAAAVLNNLGNVERELGRLDEAIAILGRAVAAAPHYAEALNNLGSAEVARGRHEDAVLHLNQAIALRPNDGAAWMNLGSALSHLARYGEAAAAYERAVELMPEFVEAHGALGDVLLKRGRVGPAVEIYERALRLKPNAPDILSSLLFTRNYIELDNPLAITEHARRFGRLLPRSRERPPFANDPDPDRRLRVGLVSGDLSNHVVGHFLRGVLPNLDTSAVELFAYATSAVRDEVTDQFRRWLPNWRDAELLKIEQFAGCVRADCIDILVDLSGHTQYNRLPLFALKPAPIQVTWLGYSGTTGIEEIDYILGDARVTPPGEEDQLVETPWRMPDSYLCYTPPAADIAVAPPPALANGPVTFGSFNNILKVSDPAVALWCRMLHAIPTSRLMVKALALGDEGTAEEVRARFLRHGIGPDRLQLLGPARGLHGHLCTYNQVDIALDPFPYNGTTTTAEALWMGVPVLTLKGDRFIGHVGESMLTSAGLSDWIAADEDDFVRRAAAFAADVPGLAALRARQREQVLASPLCDAERFARNLERAFRGMWRKWCAAQTAAH